MAFIPWATHVLQWTVQRDAKPKVEQILKAGLSSDCRLQLAFMKLESLVTARQLYCGEYVLGSCTHRPSRHGSWQHLKPVSNRKEGAVEGGVGDWDEVVTR